MTWRNKQRETSANAWKDKSIPFSAFWLRSSVVSVLISLISDTWFIEPHDIKCIFVGGAPIHQHLAAGALVRRLCTALQNMPGALQYYKTKRKDCNSIQMSIQHSLIVNCETKKVKTNSMYLDCENKKCSNEFIMYFDLVCACHQIVDLMKTI